MKLNQKLYQLLNEQIKHELESAYIYYSMVSYFVAEGLDGMAQWMTAQAQEELLHASKFFNFIGERGDKVELQNLEISKTFWKSPLEAFQDALAHEEFITGKINDLMKVAIEVNDYPAKVLLDWFVSEQVEEEDNVGKVVQTLSRIGDSGQGLIMLDRELGTRVFTPPPAEEENA
ncbi:MAG: ferritin [Candidatus Neomarinimicrobiota bacterium]|nr:MAG: ferritin [Candidatus Neomarinimicrobiota bacterium]